MGEVEERRREKGTSGLWRMSCAIYENLLAKKDGMQYDTFFMLM